MEIVAQAFERAQAAEARLGDGWRWESRPESIFGGRVLILPAGATIAPWQAAEELGASAVQDSGWAKDGGPAGRVWQQPNGWTAGSGGWAHIQAPTSGLINRILYVQWR
ncbi:hypothetical protein AB1K56_03345 [Microbacterium sp. BWR-S6Y]|uniref:hypothetical protein n=1 Tax=Microbacterium sp. BWR-S6Y TaxID=3232073 RepID=UPI0035299C21